MQFPWIAANIYFNLTSDSTLVFKLLFNLTAIVGIPATLPPTVQYQTSAEAGGLQTLKYYMLYHLDSNTLGPNALMLRQS